jgi:hypothetical protein
MTRRTASTHSGSSPARAEYEQRLRAIAAEFGWQPKASRPLVPEDRWSAENPVARLAGEVLFLREQIRLVGKVIELIMTRAPFVVVPPFRPVGPYWKGGEAPAKRIAAAGKRSETKRSRRKLSKLEPA